MIENNCTVVTTLINLDREHWFDYNRKWEDYLKYFKNILSLKSNFVIYIEEYLYDFVLTERKKYDPDLESTRIIIKKFIDFPKYHLKNDIENILKSDNYKKGLLCPNAPEYNNINYNILIHSKMSLVEDAINNNFYNTDYYMWLDAGMCHDKFDPNNKNILYPNINKINIPNKITLMCRDIPSVSDLNIERFFKSHINRLTAGVILGDKNIIKEFNKKCDDILSEVMNMNLIDSEQSIHTLCYLKNKDMFNLIYNKDWYYIFYHFI